MSLSKITLLAAGLTVALATTSLATKTFAQAQNNPGNMQSDVGEDEVIYLKAETGKVTKGKMKLTAAHHTKAMAAGARELPKGAMIYRKGGKLYLLENKASAGGKTVVQDNFQDVFDGNHQY
jgi:DNA helicase TIP49 (TBP-interacting protein)